MDRQRHLAPDARDRLHSFEVKPPAEGSVDDDAVPNENIKGLAGALLDLIRLERDSAMGDAAVRSVPRLLVYDVRASSHP